MQDKKYIVYVHKNKINGKLYFGITCQDIEKRWRRNGKGYTYSCDTVFGRAIKKYGWDSFSHKVLYRNFSEEEAKWKEKFLIKMFHTYIHDPLCNGYNMTMGGEGVAGMHLSEETKRKISEAQKGEKGNNYGKHLNSEVKEKISKSLKGRISPNKGKKMSDETKRKMSISRTGLKRTYEFRQNASDRMKDGKSPHCKKVIQLDLHGNKINEYYSLTSAALSVDGDKSSIARCCKGKQKTAKGYIWRYQEDYLLTYTA